MEHTHCCGPQGPGLRSTGSTWQHALGSFEVKKLLHCFLTFQSVPSTISPDHNIKVKVSDRVISRPDCSSPAVPWEGETERDKDRVEWAHAVNWICVITGPLLKSIVVFGNRFPVKQLSAMTQVKTMEKHGNMASHAAIQRQQCILKLVLKLLRHQSREIMLSTLSPALN